VRYESVYQRLMVPIRPHVAAEVFVPRPMTEADWEQFMTVLTTMKPGLVHEPEQADTATGDGQS
jgi:hypothetical protein